MQRRDARRSGYWKRLNIFDGWQVLGTIGLVVGALTFGMLITHTRPSLPSAGSTIQLLQTLVSHTPLAQPSAEPTVEASPSPEAVAPATGQAPVPSASRSGTPARPAPSRSPAPTASATPTPSPSATPSPPRPCLYALCPSPTSTP